MGAREMNDAAAPAPEAVKADTDAAEAAYLESLADDPALDGWAPEPARRRAHPAPTPAEPGASLGIRFITDDTVPPGEVRVMQAGEQVARIVGVEAMNDGDRVPDDYRSQAAGYRAGWNDRHEIARRLASAPQPTQRGGEGVGDA